jgi:vacuolar iron transporter family protein
MGAALSSYILFAVGAIVPVFPFLFLSGWPAIAASVLASTAGLFGLGAATTLFTGRSVLWAGSRQVVVGAAAAILTYALGAILGTSVSG